MKTIFTLLTTAARRGKGHTNLKILGRFLLLLAGFFLVYTVLFHLLMAMEGQDHSWLTGLYWTLTVMSTLGFGDITFHSDLGRAFSIVVLLTGVIVLMVMLPFTFIQFFYAPWLEAQNEARAPRQVPEGTRGHVVLTHFDDLAAEIVARVEQHGFQSVVLTADLPGALELHDRGFRVMVGELDLPETYRRARARDASLVAVLNEDEASTNIIATVREVADRVPVVTNAERDESLDILELAGATRVFQFHRLLGESLARRVAGVSMKANVIGRLDELLVAEAPAMETPFVGQTLVESRLRQLAGVNVIGVWEQGEFRMATPRTRIAASTVLVLAGSEAQLDRYGELAHGEGARDRQQGPVLVLGGGRVGRAVAATLADRGIDYRVVEKRPRHEVDQKLVAGSAADHEVLLRAGIETSPSVIVTTHDDDTNIYLTIYCRRLRPDVQIISRATKSRNVNTLHRAGANLVMSYGSLCTTTIINMLRPGSLLMLTEGISVFTAKIDARFAGRSLLDLRIREETGCSVIAVKRDGSMAVNPDPRAELGGVGDEVVLMGDTEAIDQFVERYPPV